MINRKFLIIEKNLIKAMRLEKVLKDAGAQTIGIATDYVTSMLLVKKQAPDVVFVNPNLTLEGEGLGIMNEIKSLIDCDFQVFKSDLSEVLKQRFSAVNPYPFIEESNDKCLVDAMQLPQSSFN